jgi:HSP20 family molecular chaperone IbpA
MEQFVADIITMLHPEVQTVAGRVFKDVERELESYLADQGTSGNIRRDLLKTNQIDVDVMKRVDSYVIYVDLPGFEENHVNLFLSKDRVIVIKADRPGKASTDGEFLKRSRLYGSYACEVQLPQDADVATALVATMSCGVLEVQVKRIPPTDQVEGMQRIPIISTDHHKCRKMS